MMLRQPITARESVNSLLFEAEPMVHPHVLAAFRKASRALESRGIVFRSIGGIALNLRGAGRPTRDIDLVVSRADWLEAIDVLRHSIGTDLQGIRFGLPDEPACGLAVIGPHGVPIEVWPAGTTHATIARLRGAHRPHPAGDLVLTLAGDDDVNLINSKLASYLSATDRLRDAADVEALIKRQRLPLDYAQRLAPPVRGAYRRLWKRLHP